MCSKFSGAPYWPHPTRNGRKEYGTVRYLSELATGTVRMWLGGRLTPLLNTPLLLILRLHLIRPGYGAHR